MYYANLISWLFKLEKKHWRYDGWLHQILDVGYALVVPSLSILVQLRISSIF